MNKAALNFYETVRRDGTQKEAVRTMQTRAELYDFLGYHEYERKLDELFAQGKVTRRGTPIPESVAWACSGAEAPSPADSRAWGCRALKRQVRPTESMGPH